MTDTLLYVLSALALGQITLIINLSRTIGRLEAQMPQLERRLQTIERELKCSHT